MIDIGSSIDNSTNKISDFNQKIIDLQSRIEEIATTFDSFNSKLETDTLEELIPLYEELNSYEEERRDLMTDLITAEGDEKKAITDRLKALNHSTTATQKSISQLTKELNNSEKEISKNKIASKLSGLGKNFNAFGGKLNQFGGVGQKVGNMFQKSGAMMQKGAGKALGTIGLIIQGLNLLASAAKEIAETRAELMKIQDERNTAKTERNVELFKLNIDRTSDQINTVLTKGMADLNQTILVETGKAQVANMEAIASVNAKLGTITSTYNDAAWASRMSQIDIETAKEKNAINVAAGATKAANIKENADVQYNANELNRGMKAVDIALQYKETMQKLNHEENNKRLEGGIKVAATSVVNDKSDLSASPLGEAQHYKQGKLNADGTFTDNGAMRQFDASSSDRSTLSSTNSVVGQVLDFGGMSFYKDGAATYETIMQANENRALNNEKNQQKVNAAVVEAQGKIQTEVTSATTKIADTVADASASVKSSAADAAATVKKQYAQAAQSVEKWLLEFEKNSLLTATNKGMYEKEQTKSFNNYMISAVKEISKATGFKSQDILNIQNDYGSTSGRSLIANNDDLKNAAYLNRFAGDSKMATNIANASEIFNMGMSDTVNLVWDMTKKVNKMGLDGKKYMKDMSNNLKIAQKYNFKDGVKGMMEIAKWAQDTRFNMSTLPSLVDKILDGGLEGTITQAASLQVMGGQFAMGADPLAMMFESIDDNGDLAKRYADMLKGLGTLNTETGEVEFKGVNKLLARNFGKTVGMDLSEVQAIATQAVKKEKIGSLVNSNLTDDQKSTLYNKAYMKDGNWVVNDVQGNAVDVRNVDSSNINTIQAEADDKTLEEAVPLIVSNLDKSIGLQEAISANINSILLANGTFEEEQRKRYETALETYENPQSWAKKFASEWETATENYRIFKEDESNPLNKIASAAGEAVGAINSQGGAITGAINNLAKSLNLDNNIVDSNTEAAAIKAAISGFHHSYGHGKDEDFVGDIRKLKENAIKKYTIQTGDAKGTIDYEQLARSSEFKALLSKGKHDIEYHLQKQGIINDYDDKLTAEQAKAVIDSLNETNFKDGIASGNGSSMNIAASKVTPIHDGSIARTDPKDMGLFAKTGGPFDTLFNGIFAKINEVSNVLPKSLEYIMPLSKLVSSSFSGYKDTANNDKIQIDTVKIELNGKLELTSNNGQSINIIEELKNNPILLRSLSQMISESVNKNISGGKSTYTGGIVNPRFKGMGF